jgi:anti-sigma factor RsiW
MKHDDIRQLLALRLYGEIDDAQRERVESHVAGCDDCRTFADELERGLGAVHAGRVEDDGAWIDALQRSIERDEIGRSIEREEPVRRISPWWVAAAGFAAGLLAFWLATRAGASHEIVPREEQTAQRVLSPYEHFLGDTPPPRSDSSGGLTRLGEYLAH